MKIPLEVLIKRVGRGYMRSSKEIRILVGRVLEGKIRLERQGGESFDQN